jgi:hypothetical protein
MRKKSGSWREEDKMTDKDLWSLIVSFSGSFLGGGVIGLVLGYFLDLQKMRKTNNYNLIEQQLKLLYSPVDYYLDLLVKILNHYDSIFNEFNKDYLEGLKIVKNYKDANELTKYSDEKRKEHDQLFEVKENFYSYIKAYLENINLIIKDYIYLSESEDKDLFVNMIFVTIRHESEINEKGVGILPFDLQLKLDDIIHYKQEVHEKLKARISKMKLELYGLRRPKNSN